MGGSSKQEEANRAMEAENLARQRESDRARLESEGIFRAQEYKTKREQALQGAELEAGAGVTAERTKLISESGTLLTDWEAQEKERFMKAKRGIGQVGAEDVAITGQTRQEALDLLGKGSEYWDARRGVARSEASKAAGLAFGEEFGTEEEYVRRGGRATQAGVSSAVTSLLGRR